MNKTFNTAAQFNKSAIIGDIGHPTGHFAVEREIHRNFIPRICLKLFHAKADALGFRIDFHHLHFHRLTDIYHFRRVIDTPPGNISDMQQAVNAAQINKGTIISDVFDHTFNNLAFNQILHDFIAGFGAGFFHNGPPRNHNIAAPTIHFQNLKGLRHIHQRRNIAHRTNIDLTARQKRRCAVQINGKAAFDATKNHAFNALIGLKDFSSLTQLSLGVPCRVTKPHRP